MLEAILSDLSRAVAACGLSFDDIGHCKQAVALFGSRAAGCARPASDWDLLCIGHGRSRKLAGLDLVFVEPRSLDDGTFFGGDLASHALAFGCWLDGACPWGSADLAFSLAARRKEERLARKLNSLSRAWELLGPAYRTKHATLVRRDVQRLASLHCRDAVPPTAYLDRDWLESPRAHRELREALTELGATRAFVDAIAQHAILRT
jgi:hypothetical protein